MRKKFIAGAVAALVLFMATAVLISQKQGLAVETVEVGEREICQKVLANGYFAAAQEMEIAAWDALVIKELLVQVSDLVNEGQALALVDTDGLQAEKQTIEAKLAAVNAQLATLQATLPLLKAQAESELVAAEESLRQAEQEAAALARLYEAGAVAEMEWQRGQSALLAGRAQEQAARTRLAQTQSQEVLVEQYCQQSQALNSRVQVLEEKLDYYQMKAPAAGQVMEISVEDGAVAGAGAPLFKIAAPGLVVKAEVLAQDAPKLAPGQKAIISGEVLGGSVAAGTLARIHPRAEEKLSELGVLQRRVPVEVAPDKTPPGMLPGYPVELELITAETIAPALPREAVFTLDGGDKTFIVENGRAFLTSLEIGLEGEDHLEILSGLKAGETVIINPPKELTDGAKVKQIRKN